MVRRIYGSLAYWGACLILCLWSMLPLIGQTIAVEAPNTVEVGRPFYISYRVDGADVSEFHDPKASDNLELIYGPAVSQSTSIQITNGRTVSSIYSLYTYTYIAQQAGTGNISGAWAEIEGKNVSAKPIKIRILPEGKGGGDSSSSGRMGKYLYRLIVPRREVYEQEAFPIIYKLYATTSFGVEDTSPPEYDGFLSQNLKPDGPTQIDLEQYQGVTYQTAIVYHESLSAQKTGQLTIPANKITIRIPIPNPDNPFLGTSIPKQIETSSETIHVLPLPEEGKPVDFSGAVGSFTISAKFDSLLAKTGEALKLTLTAEGEGNLKLVEMPRPEFPETFDVYDPVESYEQQVRGTKLQAKRVVEYHLVPRQVGQYSLPAIVLNYFDPQTKRYRTAQTTPLRVDVAKGRDAVRSLRPSQIEEASRGELRSLHRDYDTGDGLSSIRFVRGFFYPVMYLLIALMGIGVYRILRTRQLAMADVRGQKARKAGGVATKRLSKAREKMAEGDDRAFYVELESALYGYLGDKFSIASSEFSRQTIRELLREHGVETLVVDECVELIDTIEYTRFGPGSVEEKMHTLYGRVSELISTLEDRKYTYQSSSQSDGY